MTDLPIAWKATSLNKGQFMVKESGDAILTISHLDRTVDPYLAGVTKKGVITYTGLHATLADARQTCEKKAKYP